MYNGLPISSCVVTEAVLKIKAFWWLICQICRYNSKLREINAKIIKLRKQSKSTIKIGWLTLRRFSEESSWPFALILQVRFPCLRLLNVRILFSYSRNINPWSRNPKKKNCIGLYYLHKAIHKSSVEIHKVKYHFKGFARSQSPISSLCEYSRQIRIHQCKNQIDYNYGAEQNEKYNQLEW